MPTAFSNNPSIFGPLYDITYTREDGTKVTPREMNKKRQEVILNKMAEVINPETGVPFITEAQRDAAKAEVLHCRLAVAQFQPRFRSFSPTLPTIATMSATENLRLGLVADDMVVGALGMGGLTRGLNTVEMAAAYACFANNGVYNEPRTYVRVTRIDSMTFFHMVMAGLPL